MKLQQMIESVSTEIAEAKAIHQEALVIRLEAWRNKQTSRLERLKNRNPRPRKPTPHFRKDLVARQKKMRPREDE